MRRHGRVGASLTTAAIERVSIFSEGRIVRHNITNVSKKPARVLMTVSPPGHEHYFEELARLTELGAPPDPKAIGELRARYDTEQLSALTTGA